MHAAISCEIIRVAAAAVVFVVLVALSSCNAPVFVLLVVTGIVPSSFGLALSSVSFVLGRGSLHLLVSWCRGVVARGRGDVVSW